MPMFIVLSSWHSY